MIFSRVSIFLLWIAAVFDPIGNLYHLRYIALGASLIAIVWNLITQQVNPFEKSYRWLFIALIAIIMPAYGTLLYLLKGRGGDFIDTSYIASGLLILTSLLYANYGSCRIGVSSFVCSTRILSFVIIVISVFQETITTSWISFITERNIALVSTRNYTGIPIPYIYFLASPLLILLLAHDFHQMKAKLTIINTLQFVTTTSALSLSGTRAHILIAIFGIPIYMLLFSNLRRLVKAATVLIVFIILICAFKDSRALLLAYFSLSEGSNSMKIDEIGGYIEIFSNPLTLLFGQGFNAHEWSPELRNMVSMEVGASKTELTYLELIRVFGLFVATPFICGLFFFTVRLKRLTPDLEWLYAGFVMFLINAAFNPYLFSTNGILPLGLAASILYYREVSLHRTVSIDFHVKG